MRAFAISTLTFVLALGIAAGTLAQTTTTPPSAGVRQISQSHCFRRRRIDDAICWTEMDRFGSTEGLFPEQPKLGPPVDA